MTSAGVPAGDPVTGPSSVTDSPTTAATILDTRLSLPVNPTTRTGVATARTGPKSHDLSLASDRRRRKGAPAGQAGERLSS